MADVHQCPACELRFLNRTELDSHWAQDHPARAEGRESTDVPDQPRP